MHQEAESNMAKAQEPNTYKMVHRLRASIAIILLSNHCVVALHLCAYVYRLAELQKGILHISTPEKR
jgi:hypothetical protein